jgi:hypothetical protein
VGVLHFASGSGVVDFGVHFTGPFASLNIFIWATDSIPAPGFNSAGVAAGPDLASFFSAVATYCSIIESSLSTDSDVDTVSMWASGVTYSLPFREVYWGRILMAVWSLLVVGWSSSSGIVFWYFNFIY